MTSKVWDKQHGGSHYQKYKIQPSKFVVEKEWEGRYIESHTFFRNDYREGLQ
jgi:hypothetical protein